MDLTDFLVQVQVKVKVNDKDGPLPAETVHTPGSASLLTGSYESNTL